MAIARSHTLARDHGEHASSSVVPAAETQRLPALTAARLAIVLFFFCIAAFRGLVLSFDHNETAPNDIAAENPRIYTYSLVLVLAALLLGGAALRRVPVWFGVSAAFAIVLAITHWQQNSVVAAGLLHLAFAALAWVVGAGFAAEELKRPDPSGFIIIVVFSFVCMQAVVVVLQTIGVLETGSLTAAGEIIRRASGTIGHPGNLGKILLFMLFLALPALVSGVRRTRRLGLWTVILVLIAIGLTYSRANVIALAGVLLVWVLVAPGQKASGRVGLIAVLGLILLPFVDALIARFESDPDGGLRPLLWDAAMEQLARDPWFGVGPNAFVGEVGEFSSAVASGYPVHNTFVLLWSELGALAAVAFMLPLTLAVTTALRKQFTGRTTPGSAALLASIPAVVAIGWTGWGLLAAPMLQVWFFVTGMLVTMMNEWSSREQE